MSRKGERLRARGSEPLRHRTGRCCLAKAHPEVAARVFRALGMRILKAKKSKYYAAALSHFEDVDCYRQAGHESPVGRCRRGSPPSPPPQRGFYAGFRTARRRKDRARSRPLSIVRGTAGYREAHDRQRVECRPTGCRERPNCASCHLIPALTATYASQAPWSARAVTAT